MCLVWWKSQQGFTGAAKYGRVFPSKTLRNVPAFARASAQAYARANARAKAKGGGVIPDGCGMGVTSMFCPGNCPGRMRMGSCPGWGFVRAHRWQTHGFCLGTGMGICLGTWMGFCLGTWMGFCLGTWMGFCLGTWMGFCLGTWMGFCLGTWMGFCLGISMAIWRSACIHVWANSSKLANPMIAKPHPDAPIQVPGQNLIQMPGQNPIQMPGQNPIQRPRQNPIQRPGQNPIQVPRQRPGKTSGMTGAHSHSARVKKIEVTPTPHPLHTHFLVSLHPLSLLPGHLPGHMPGQKLGHFSRFLTGIPFHSQVQQPLNECSLYYKTPSLLIAILNVAVYNDHCFL